MKFYDSVLVRSRHFNRWSLRFCIIVAIHCFFLVLTNCGFLPATAWADAIRLGEVNPLTGNLALHGQEIHEGIVMAVEEINSRGGLHGRQVELISRDDQSRPDVALNQTQDLLYREKVVGLLGGYVDSLVGPISSLAARSGTPYVAVASLQKSLTDKKNPFFFKSFQYGRSGAAIGPISHGSFKTGQSCHTLYGHPRFH